MRWGAIVLLVLAAAGPAWGQADRSAEAQALFDEGQRLVDAGDVAHACPKFERSERLDPALGTLMNLADCYERAGRTASAWSTFRAAQEQAEKVGDVRESVARTRADALENRLPRLTIEVGTGARPAGLVVSRDGEPIDEAGWGTAVPLDPGTHVVAATAPGREGWHTTIEIHDGDQARVTVPELIVAKVAPAVATSPSVGPVVGASAPAAEPGVLVRFDVEIGAENGQGKTASSDFSFPVGLRLGFAARVRPHLFVRLAGHLVPGEQGSSGALDAAAEVEGRVAVVPFVELFASGGPAFGYMTDQHVSHSGPGGQVRGGVSLGRSGFGLSVCAIYDRISDSAGGFGWLSIIGGLSFGFHI